MKQCSCSGGESCRKNTLLSKRLYMFALGCIILLAFLAACKGRNTDTKQYDRARLLQNYAQNLIVPAWSALKTNADSLNATAAAFLASPDNSGLNRLRASLKTCWTQYQYCSLYEFGPAETQQVRAQMNTFPCDTSKISANLSAGTWDLSQPANLSAKGFPALDFLFWGIDSNAVLNMFTGSPGLTRRTYAQALVTDLCTRISAVAQEWNGTYSGTFTASLGTDVGSSTGLLVNQYNYDLDIMKNGQVGIPLGKKTLGVALPEKCEAFYGGFSLDLLKAHAAALSKAFRGFSDLNQTDGYGLDDVLDDLETKTASGQLLSQAIAAEFAKLDLALNAIPNPLSASVQNSALLVDSAYVHIQQLLVWNKSDMPSAMGILITYQDADGD